MPVPGQPKVGTRLPLPSAKSRFRSTSATPAYSCATTTAGSRPIRKQSSAISARSISMSSKIGFWIHDAIWLQPLTMTPLNPSLVTQRSSSLAAWSAS
jgi:hypothetical protein